MEIKYEIRHGSVESIDEDYYLVVKELPTQPEFKEFLKTTTKDYNCITIEDGKVTGCLRGTVDEINNSIYYTFSNHKQSISENPIKNLVERDVFIKVNMVVRDLLSHVSRTHLRVEVKKALTECVLSKRIRVLHLISLTTIEDFGKTTKQEALKIYAQRIGLLIALLEGKELFDKSDYKDVFKPFLYRREITPDNVVLLDYWLHSLTNKLMLYFDVVVDYEVGEIVHLNDGKVFDVKYEKYI